MNANKNIYSISGVIKEKCLLKVVYFLSVYFKGDLTLLDTFYYRVTFLCNSV